MSLWSVIVDPTVGKIGATAAAIGACVIIEDIFPKGARLSFRDRFPGAALAMAQASVWFLILVPLQAIYEWLGISAFIVVPLAEWTAPLGFSGVVLNVLVMLLVTDFLHYWWHRADHRWLVMWSVHAAHHAPRRLHAANNYGHPFQIISGFVFMGVPLSLFQISSLETPVTVAVIFGLAEYLIHSPTSFHLGALRNVLVDNRFHRIHHSIEPRHIGKNFGIVFTFWDRLFGTAYFPSQNEWPEVGVRELPEPRNMRELFLLPLYIVGLKSRDSVRRPARPV